MSWRLRGRCTAPLFERPSPAARVHRTATLLQRRRERDEFTSIYCAMPPVLATRRIAHLDTAETGALRDFNSA